MTAVLQYHLQRLTALGWATCGGGPDPRDRRKWSLALTQYPAEQFLLYSTSGSFIGL